MLVPTCGVPEGQAAVSLEGRYAGSPAALNHVQLQFKVVFFFQECEFVC